MRWGSIGYSRFMEHGGRGARGQPPRVRRQLVQDQPAEDVRDVVSCDGVGHAVRVQRDAAWERLHTVINRVHLDQVVPTAKGLLDDGG